MKTEEYTNDDGSRTEKDKSFLLLKKGLSENVKLYLNVTTQISDTMHIATLKNSDENLWPGKYFWSENKKYFVNNIDSQKVYLTCDENQIVLEKGFATEDPGTVLEFEFKKKPDTKKEMEI